MSQSQNFKNHTRYDPSWHFFLLPLAVLNLAFAVAITVHHWPGHRIIFSWFILMSMAFIVLVVKSRTNPLKAQDRIIRLEERLRYAGLLPPDLLARCSGLTEQQVVALRFAPDAELAALIRRALDENLSQKQIKESIVHWRPDYFRV